MMRTLSFLFFFLFLNGSSLAKCAQRGFWAYPSSDEVPRNARFIVGAYGKTLGLLDSLNDGYRVHLESAGHEVDLEVVEKNRGYSIEQLLLRPKSPLKAGKSYRLRFDGIGEEREKRLLISYDDEKEKELWTSWRVKAEKDTEAPVWKVRPELRERVYQELGCGPSVKAVFRMEARDASEVWVRIQLKEVETGTVDQYILPLRGGEVELGHGMCSGAFSYQKEGEYKARFRIMDASGNQGKDWTEWIAYRSPMDDGWW